MLYRILLVLLVVSVLFTSYSANAEEIPNWIKGKIKLWTLDKVEDKYFADSLVDLNKRDLLQLQNIIPVKNSYALPKYGETIFIKIDGRVNDFGRTSPVSLVITRPDGIRTQYTVPVIESGTYSTSIPISYDFPVGTYQVNAYHHDNELPASSIYVQKHLQIPPWIKNNAKWWLDGKISDSDFLGGMQYLIRQKIIPLDVVDIKKIDPSLDVTIDGLKAVRRGTTQNLGVHVENFEGIVKGATISIRVEDYGGNILKEFEGVTDPNGNYSVSWELRDFNDIETFVTFVDVTDGLSSKTEIFAFQVYCLCGESNCKCRN